MSHLLGNIVRHRVDYRTIRPGTGRDRPRVITRQDRERKYEWYGHSITDEKNKGCQLNEIRERRVGISIQRELCVSRIAEESKSREKIPR